MGNSHSESRRTLPFAIFTIALGMVGLFASFELLTEHIKTLMNPDYIANCEISVLVTCGPNMASWQGAIFGFSNTVIGMAAFAAPIVVGMALLAGARFAPWFWWLYIAGLLSGFLFICWLAYQSIFILGTLCPWCMVVWLVVIPLWWTTLFRTPAVGAVATPKGVRRAFEGLYSWTWVWVLLTYVVIAAIAQFRLDWFAEFARL